MAPKAKVTRDMIVAAAVEVARRDGHESINARTVAQQLSCSTQPVMYHFATIEELKRAAFARADRLHTEYLLQPPAETDPLLSIGLHYIRFAVEEPQLFRFLFQSGYTEEKSLKEIFDSEELTPILAALQAELGGDAAEAREVFLILALFTHLTKTWPPPGWSAPSSARLRRRASGRRRHEQAERTVPEA